MASSLSLAEKDGSLTTILTSSKYFMVVPSETILEGMEKAIWAVFYHSVSTDNNPQHQYCPLGKDSWCKYQRAITDSNEIPTHNPNIPADLSQYMKPVLARLSSTAFLEKCVLVKIKMNVLLLLHCVVIHYAMLMSPG